MSLLTFGGGDAVPVPEESERVKDKDDRVISGNISCVSFVVVVKISERFEDCGSSSISLLASKIVS